MAVGDLRHTTSEVVHGLREPTPITVPDGSVTGEVGATVPVDGGALTQPRRQDAEGISTDRRRDADASFDAMAASLMSSPATTSG